MTPERRRGVEGVYHAAWKHAPDERGAFLAETCGADLELRREVEALLAEDRAPLASADVKASANNLAKPALPGSINGLTRDRPEDPLDYLPCSTIANYAKGQMIYGSTQPSNSIFLVIDGKVKVCRRAADGHSVVVDIYLPDEFFGESGFLSDPNRVEDAVAVEGTKVMAWSTAEIKELVIRKPRLGLAMVQLLVRRSLEFGSRIESFAVDSIERRLVRSLIRFSERLGRGSADGFTDMMPFTHELLSQYVGSSREVVTQCMNQLRRKGYLRYSRRGIALDTAALRDWLKGDTLGAGSRSHVTVSASGAVSHANA